MITRAGVEKLGAVHAVEPAVLSLYLSVPPHPAEPRRLIARANELIAAAEGNAGRWHLSEDDQSSAMEMVATAGRNWPGRTVAIFTCADAGLNEAIPVRCGLPERAVLGTRPHIRPLLVVLQQCPAYHVVVADGGHAWMCSLTGDEIESVTACHHYRDAAAMLKRDMRHGEHEPLVVGGRDGDVRDLLAGLQPIMREDYAGSFDADSGMLTPARVRDLAAPVIARWSEQRTQHLAGEILATPPGGLAAVGLPACLAAVNSCAAETLVVPADGLVPGYECGRCGALSTAADSCPDWGTAPLQVPDVIEEMVSRTLEDGGQVTVIRDASSPVVARLHFPVTP